MSVELLRSLYRLGKRLAPIKLETIEATTKSPVYELEIGGSTPVLSLVTERSYTVARPHPSVHGRTGVPTPNYGHDSVNYVLHVDEARFDPFWTQLAADLEALDEKDILRDVKRARTKLAAAPGKLESGAGATRVWSTLGLKKIPHKGRVIITRKGEPLAEMKRLRAYWAKKATATSREAPTHTDVITGEPCVAVRVHHKIESIRGTGGKTPLVGFEADSFRYAEPLHEKRDRGFNLAASEETNRAYADGFQHVIDNWSSEISDRLTLVAWPEDGVTHPLIPLIVSVMRGYVKNEKMVEVWRDIEAILDAGDDGHFISVALFDGTRSRVAFLGFRTLGAQEVAAALLRFRNEFVFVRSQPTFRSVARFTGRESKDDQVKKDPGDSDVVFRGTMLSQLAWAVITGTPYPLSAATILNAVMVRTPEFLNIYNAWMSAIRSRAIAVPNERIVDSCLTTS